MPYIDLIVLVCLLIGTGAAFTMLWRRGLRRRRLLASLWFSFYGIVLIAMMMGHCVDILYNLIIGGTARDGSPWIYNFRTYALYLLAAVLIRQGITVLQAVLAFSRGEQLYRTLILRAAVTTLLIVVPLLSIQTIFAVLLTTLSTVSLILVAVWREEPVAAESEEAIAVAA